MPLNPSLKLNIKSGIKFETFFLIGAVLWGALVVSGLFIVGNYENSPNFEVRPAPAHWPEASGLSLARDRYTLVMLAHPKCPCTRASLGELERLMAETQGKIQTYILFVRPAGFSESWVKTDLWQKAEKIPGVQVVMDDKGAKAKYFNGSTSGETYLYDAKGNLMFAGGITASRGHEGDNAGRSAIDSLIQEGKSNLKQTYTFGCALFSHPSEKSGGK